MDETPFKPNINDLLDRNTYKYQPIPNRIEVKEFDSDWEERKEPPECLPLTMHETKETISQILNQKGHLEGHPDFSYPKRQKATCKDVDLNTIEADETVQMFIKLSGVGGDPENVKKVMSSVHHESAREEVYPELDPYPNSDLYPDYKKGRLLFCTNGVWHGKDELKSSPKKHQPGVLSILTLIGKYLKGKTITSNMSNKLVINGVETKFDLCKIHKAIQELGNVISAKEAEKFVTQQVAKKIADVL